MTNREKQRAAEKRYEAKKKAQGCGNYKKRIPYELFDPMNKYLNKLLKELEGQ